MLDGVDDHLVVSSLAYDGSYPITLEAWVLPESDRTCVIMTLGGIITVNIQQDDRLLLSIGALTQDETFHLLADKDVRLGEWIHVAGIYDGKSLSVFVNGRRQNGLLQHQTWRDGTDESTIKLLTRDFPAFKLSPIWDGIAFAVGANPWAQPEYFSAFKGKVDEVRISHGVRYTRNFVPQNRFTEDDQTLALYHFDSCIAGIARDASANGHDGRIVRTVE